jgi:DnaJ-class molecular chaperone
VILPLPLTRAEAERGARKRVALDGDSEILVTVPSGTCPGTRLRLRGKGRPRPDGSRGDAYLAVEIHRVDLAQLLQRMRSWVLKEDLGEKVTVAEWTLLWLAAETKIALDGLRPKQQHGEDGHEVADAPGEDTRRATAWAWSSIAFEPVHDQDATQA